jgi:hypothetical protein
MDISKMSHDELNRVEELIHKRRVALYELEPKFLPEDVREELRSELITADYECNGDQFDADDYSLATDDELVEQYGELCGADDEDCEDELYLKAMGHRAVHYMLLPSGSPLKLVK